MNNVTLMTCSGGMQIIYLNSFPDRVAWEMVSHNGVSVVTPKGLPISNVADFPLIEQKLKRVDYQLNDFAVVSHMELVARQGLRNGFGDVIHEKMREGGRKRIAEEFQIMVAQKTPEFFLKDLSMDAIEDLSVKYAEAMGSDPVGIEIRLGPYQKFFVICSAEDFKFFCYQYENVAKADICFKGKLINTRPDRMIMGRYENHTYLKELSAMRLYTASPDSRSAACDPDET